MDWTPLITSIQVAFASTLLALVIGVPIAWWLARQQNMIGNILSSVILVPMVLPPTVLGFYLLQVFGRQSFIGSIFETIVGFPFVFHWSGAVLAAFVTSAPFLIRTTQAGFESMDKSFEEAAASLGKSPITVFFTISIPLSKTAIWTGIAMAMARALGEFGATLMIGGSIPGQTQTMSIAIYEAVQSNRLADAQIMALALSFVTVGLLVAIGTRREKRKGY